MMICESVEQWNQFLVDHPEAHLLQQGAWGTLKSHFGWDVERIICGSAGVQILFRRLPLGFSIAYIPKGPVGSNWQQLWPEIDRICKKRRAIFLKVEPDAWVDDPISSEASSIGFNLSKPIQPRRTIVISLDGDEDRWLDRMKQKTRYNIRLAQKKDVMARESSDVNVFYELMQVTGDRDGFGVHSLAYYQKAYSEFSPGGNCAILLAEYAGQPLAGLMIFRAGSRAWYFYGASNDQERNRMPAYLLQWEAMRWAAARGCTSYDLWGIPDEDEDRLEAEFSDRSDGLWGVYRFKRGFGGEIRRSLGAYDRVYSRLLYRAYQWYARRVGREE